MSVYISGGDRKIRFPRSLCYDKLSNRVHLRCRLTKNKPVVFLKIIEYNHPYTQSNMEKILEHYSPIPMC